MTKILFPLFDFISGAGISFISFKMFQLRRTREEFKNVLPTVIANWGLALTGICLLFLAFDREQNWASTIFQRTILFALVILFGTIWLLPTLRQIQSLPRIRDLEALNRSLFLENKNRQKAEMNLRLLNENLETLASERTVQLRTLIDQSPLAIVRLDAAGTILLWNPAAEKIFGWHEAEVHGRTQPTLPVDRIEESRNALQKALLGGETLQFETQRIHKSGEELTVCMWLAPVVSPEGQATAICVYQDITEKRQIEQSLETARQKAETAITEKGRLLSYISHELRSPIGSIIGFVDLMFEEDLTEAEKKSHLQIIQRNCHYLNYLINDFLDLSKLESGHLELENREICVQSLIEETVNSIRIQHCEKNIKIFCRGLEALPPSLITDSNRLRQILTNMINNAVKFTPKGFVMIEPHLSQDSPRSALLEIAVVDSGIGIAPDQIHHLFHPFTQADRSTHRKFGGTGLGLHLTRLIVNAMGGEVFLRKSAPDAGSEFVVQLPVGLPPTLALSSTV